MIALTILIITVIIKIKKSNISSGRVIVSREKTIFQKVGYVIDAKNVKIVEKYSVVIKVLTTVERKLKIRLENNKRKNS